MDIFESKSIKPMLIGESGEPFDHPDFIYELKLDGERCLAYLDPKEGTDLRNKRNMLMLAKFPELSEIHKQVKARCVLDGELIVTINGVPVFSEVKRRSITTNKMKIELAIKQAPASFVAFDILYWQGESVMDKPLAQRKELLSQAFVSENERLALSRHIETGGMALYDLAAAKGLEGVVAKRKASLYYPDKRTKDWIKIKNLQDDDYVVCGYIEKEKGVVSVILGQYDGERLANMGHVTLGVSSRDFAAMRAAPAASIPPFSPIPKGNENAVWLRPVLVCTVKYMEKLASGSLRQPVFKGLREDKEPFDCKVS